MIMSITCDAIYLIPPPLYQIRNSDAVRDFFGPRRRSFPFNKEQKIAYASLSFHSELAYPTFSNTFDRQNRTQKQKKPQNTLSQCLAAL
jgi:hypothetical protein